MGLNSLVIQSINKYICLIFIRVFNIQYGYSYRLSPFLFLTVSLYFLWTNIWNLVWLVLWYIWMIGASLMSKSTIQFCNTHLNHIIDPLVNIVTLWSLNDRCVHSEDLEDLEFPHANPCNHCYLVNRCLYKKTTMISHSSLDKPTWLPSHPI